MARLTTFSKFLIVGILTLFLILLISMCWSCTIGCNRQNQQNYGYQQQPVYQQPVQPQVVYVQQPDGSSVMMNYLLWKSLMDQGGETHVYNYYNQHRNDDEFRQERQQQYRQVYEQEKVRTQKSNGFGSKSVETQKSNGFGKDNFGLRQSKPIDYDSKTKSVKSNQSSGFGLKPKSTNSISTKKSGGFGKRN